MTTQTPRARRVRALATATLATGALITLAACGGTDTASEPNPDTTTADPSSAAPTAEATAGSDAGVPVTATDRATDLVSPWGLVALDDGSMLVGSRDTGEIALVGAGGAREVLRTIDVRAEGESGLLGLAATDDESTVFALYSTEEDDRVVSMSFDGATLGEPEVIFDGIPGGAQIHQGGGLEVGPDGFLYVATGDNDTPDSAQDPDSLSGKILRLNLDGTPAEGNPFDSAVYTLGHRNVQGLAFDDQGRLWASEFGSGQWDELNLIEAGNNYGWPELEGTGGEPDFVDPEAVWATNDASPSGLAFWDGSLWMASLAGQTLWEIPLVDGDAGQPVAQLAGEYGRLRNVETSADDGSLVLATSNTDGRGAPADDDDRLLTLTR